MTAIGIFGISSGRAAARDRMTIGKPGDFISAEEMARVVGANCSDSKSTGWRLVSREIRSVETSHALFWRWDPERKGWKCLTDVEKPKECDTRIRRIRRAAKRTVRVAQSVDMSQLSHADRAQIAVSLVVAGAIEILSKGSTTKKLVGYVSDTTALPDESTIIDAVMRRENKSN